MILPDQGDGESVKMFVSDVGTTAPPRHSLSSDGQTGCYSGREVRLTGNLGPGHKAPRFPRSRPRTIVSPLGSGVAGAFSYSLCFAKIKLRVVQFRGFSKMTLSSLQAQAPRVTLSGLLTVELH